MKVSQYPSTICVPQCMRVVFTPRTSVGMSLLWFYFPTQRLYLPSPIPLLSPLFSSLLFSYPSHLFTLSLPPSLPPSLGIHHHFSEEPEDTTVGQGATALLRCHLSDSNPPAIYRWKKDGHPISPDNGRVVLSPSGYLYIRNVTETDEGEYQCLAENEVTGKSRRSRVSSLSVNGETLTPSTLFSLPLFSPASLFAPLPSFFLLPSISLSLFSPSSCLLFPPLSDYLSLRSCLSGRVSLSALPFTALSLSRVCLCVCES